MRPANIVTAISDILAGLAISGYLSVVNWNTSDLTPVLLLVVATVGLYGGGVVFNDVFDAELDQVERPERPIPSGLIKKNHAALFASLLLILGVLSAAMVHPDTFFSISYFLAVAIAIGALIYDKWAKHHVFLGPVSMGICRGLNLLLGISILPVMVQDYWYLGFVPLIYIAAITMVSRGEVHGGSRNILRAAAAMYSVVIITVLYFAYIHDHAISAAAFLLLMALMIFTPLIKAISHPSGPLIGKSVKAGVLALILMNAAWAGAFGNFYLALFILLLMAVSLGLAKLFAVT